MKKIFTLLSFLILVSCSGIDRNDPVQEARYITKIINVDGEKKVRFAGQDIEELEEISKKTNIPFEKVESMVGEKIIKLLEEDKIKDDFTYAFTHLVNYFLDDTDIDISSFKERLDIVYDIYLKKNF